MREFTLKPERITQNQVVALFKNQLGYHYLGDWQDRTNNSNIEKELLTAYLKQAAYTPTQISRAFDKIDRTLNSNAGLFEVNKNFYSLLRYGVDVKTDASEPTQTVQLINWKEPHKNQFAIAEEVTIKGLDATRRPDVVIYVNGIALGVLELKRGSVSVDEGIAQLCSNQTGLFNPWFFNTAQILFAGNDSQGLRYGTIKTPAKYYLSWKEDEHLHGNLLQKYLLKMCNKERFLEIIYDCIIFDNGIKKLPRVHQYFGLKAAQDHINRKQGGIIWHTQGAGKSILMVLLAKWVLQNNPSARVVIITDRDELDKQIEKVFNASGEAVARVRSGRDLMRQLQQPTPRLLCSLVHKFGQRGVENLDAFIEELAKEPSKTYGDIVVFVDECHRTQSGKLHKTMKAIMPNAIMVGFTGTPLLKKDKQTSLETFGGYIHTYKFKEAVDDGVVLDLAYEARDVDQRLTSTEAVDEWFEIASADLNSWQKDELSKRWGTKQKVLSSENRMRRIINDILLDFRKKSARLSFGLGNGILVASSIYEACKYYKLFQSTPLKNKCAVITSYNPQTGDVSKEEMGDNSETDKQFIFNTYTELLKDVHATAGKTKAETFEDNSKKLFIEQPQDMKLLIVVDKLLTGFDAPACSVLYIDKKMQDHGLFQAICRTNRLDSPDKEFGLIVDYKDLFKRVEKAIAVYTSEIDMSQGLDADVTMQNRQEMAKDRLATALEQLAQLCEPVKAPRTEEDYLYYFCGNSEVSSDLEAHAPQRIAFYTSVVALIRAYANIKDELANMNYTATDIQAIEAKINFYKELREKIRLRSGEYLGLKPFEADMRHLIDTYIEAEAPRKISQFEEMTLVELIVNTGIADAIVEKLANSFNTQAGIAETIENNVRSTIIKDHLAGAEFQAKMSALLDEVIKLRKSQAISYEEYLKRVEALAKQIQEGTVKPTSNRMNTKGKKALYNILQQDEALVLKVHEQAMQFPDGWRGGNNAKKQAVKRKLVEILGDDQQLIEVVLKVLHEQAEYQ